MKTRRTNRRITLFLVGDIIVILIPKQDRSGLRIYRNKRLVYKILTITKHKSPRYELASEHGTLNKLYAAGI